MKMLAMIISILLTASLAFGELMTSNPLLPYGPPIRDNEGDVLTVGVSIEKTDLGWKRIGMEYLFVGKLYRSKDPDCIAAIVVDTFKQRSVNDNPLAARLRDIPFLEVGRYNVLVRDYSDGEYHSFKINILQPTAIAEVLTTDDIPIVTVSQLVIAPIDMKRK